MVCVEAEVDEQETKRAANAYDGLAIGRKLVHSWVLAPPELVPDLGVLARLDVLGYLLHTSCSPTVDPYISAHIHHPNKKSYTLFRYD